MRISDWSSDVCSSDLAWTWDDGNHHLPYHWGTEALAWRTDKRESSYADLSYGDLWTPEMKGKVMGRPPSMMDGIGLSLEDRTSVGSGKSVSVRVDLGGRRIIHKKKTPDKLTRK